MQKINVGVIGATGMVGRVFLRMLSEHPWMNVVLVAASERSAGQKMKFKIPQEEQALIDREILEMTIMDASDVESISKMVDLIFCAVDMPKDEIIRLEEAYAKKEVVVVSNNSAMRWHDDVPMIVPEINGVNHLKVLSEQKIRLGTRRGCIVVKPNCAAQAYMAIMDVIGKQIQIEYVNVSLMQAISGSGKHLSEYPSIHGNILPLVGEAEKSEKEPMKIFGRFSDGKIISDTNIPIFATSYRVPVEDGHTANVFVKTSNFLIDMYNLKKSFERYNPLADYNLPSSPEVVIDYLGDNVYPEPLRDVNKHNGMAFVCGELKYNQKFGVLQFTGMVNNIVRGAAGGAVLTAELMIKLGYVYPLK